MSGSVPVPYRTWKYFDTHNASEKSIFYFKKKIKKFLSLWSLKINCIHTWKKGIVRFRIEEQGLARSYVMSADIICIFNSNYI